jgi:hypothetical protein
MLKQKQSCDSYALLKTVLQIRTEINVKISVTLVFCNDNFVLLNIAGAGARTARATSKYLPEAA